MKSSTIKTCDTGPNSSETGKVGIRNRLKVIVASALLLAATSATAGIIWLPGSNIYSEPGLAQVNIQNLGDETIRIHTSGLTGELTIDGSDFPPEYGIATTEKVVLPFHQEMVFDLDYADGIVSGRSTVNVDASSPYLAATAQVHGTATCLPLNGLECGQLVVVLELQGVLTDPNDPSKVGQLRMETLGSLVVDSADFGVWAAMSANATIGGNEALINSALEYARDRGAL